VYTNEGIQTRLGLALMQQIKELTAREKFHLIVKRPIVLKRGQ
jgi:hypothetical protein